MATCYWWLSFSRAKCYWWLSFSREECQLANYDMTVLETWALYTVRQLLVVQNSAVQLQSSKFKHTWLDDSGYSQNRILAYSGRFSLNVVRVVCGLGHGPSLMSLVLTWFQMSPSPLARSRLTRMFRARSRCHGHRPPMRSGTTVSTTPYPSATPSSGPGTPWPTTSSTTSSPPATSCQGESTASGSTPRTTWACPNRLNRQFGRSREKKVCCFLLRLTIIELTPDEKDSSLKLGFETDGSWLTSSDQLPAWHGFAGWPVQTSYQLDMVWPAQAMFWIRW